MTGPPAARPKPSRAGGQRFEVCTAGGDFVRTVERHRAEDLIRAGLAVADEGKLKLKNGLKFISLRDESDRTAPRPDLESLRKAEPIRYRKNWRGHQPPHIGYDALGRRVVDNSIPIHPQRWGI